MSVCVCVVCVHISHKKTVINIISESLPYPSQKLRKPTVNAAEGVGKGMLIHCWEKGKLVQLWKSVERLLRELKLEPRIMQSRPNPCVYTKGHHIFFTGVLAHPCS